MSERIPQTQNPEPPPNPTSKQNATATPPPNPTSKSKPKPNATPSVMVPYQHPGQENEFDIFVMLRPTTNGYYAESRLFSHLRSMPSYKRDFTLVYLANLPGQFISERGLIASYYSNRIYITNKGKSAFTPYMRTAFEHHFGVPFDSADLLGSFEALDVLKISKEDLFNTWVPKHAVCKVLGQTIKKINGPQNRSYFILNYDIPHLLDMHHETTNIAVMCFRTNQPYKQFTKYLTQVYYMLKQDREYLESVRVAHAAPSRLFHYSHGPLEEMSDAGNFMFTEDNEQVALTNTSFGFFLMNEGYSEAEIRHLVKNPLCHCHDTYGLLKEASLFDLTRFASYRSALSTIKHISSQSFERD